MKNDMMWAYLIHLGMNMWGKKGSSWTAGYHDQLDTDEEVWKAAIDFLPGQGINTLLIDVGDALEYETHPDISIPGAWSKDKMKKELDRIRSLGITPLPKLNFSACHNAWLGKYARILSTPEYYQICRDLIREVAEVFGQPAYFHLGLDEENAKNQGRQPMCVVRQGDLWWHDAYELFDACDSVGARPWVWADLCWDAREEYIKKMPKSVLQSNWHYTQIARNADGSCVRKEPETYRVLEEAGFDQVPTGSTWSWKYNLQETMKLCKEVIAPERLKGYMTASWMMTTKEDHYALLADAYRFGCAKKKIYPEAD